MFKKKLSNFFVLHSELSLKKSSLLGHTHIETLKNIHAFSKAIFLIAMNYDSVTFILTCLSSKKLRNSLTVRFTWKHMTTLKKHKATLFLLLLPCCCLLNESLYHVSVLNIKMCLKSSVQFVNLILAEQNAWIYCLNIIHYIFYGLVTCSGCNPPLAQWQLQTAPHDPRRRNWRREYMNEWMDIFLITLCKIII